MNHNIKIIGGLILLSSHISYAQNRNQDTIIPNQNIEIIQEYKPEVKLPEKPILTPSELKFNNSYPIPYTEYIGNKDKMKIDYDAVKIKPLALTPLQDEKKYQNYIAFGLGNYRTIYGDAGFTYHKSGKYDASIHAFHLSQKGGKNYEDRISAFTDVNVAGKYLFPKFDLVCNVGLQRQDLTKYGYDHTLFNFNIDDIKQNITTLYFQLGLGDYLYHKKGFFVLPSFDAHFTSTKTGEVETSLLVKLPFSYSLSKVASIQLGIEGQLSSFKNNNNLLNNNYLLLSPGISFSKKKLKAHLGVKPTLRPAEGWGIMPDVSFRYAFGDDAKVAVNMGYVGNMVSYSLRNLLNKNPFATIDNVKSSQHNQAYLGIEMALMKNIKAEFKATYHTLDYFNTFINTSLARNEFKTITLNKFNYFSLYGGLQAVITDRFMLGLNGDINMWGNNVDSVYHEPNLRLGINSFIKPIDDLNISINVNVLNGMKYINSSEIVSELSTVFDFGIGAEYDFMKRYGIFLKINNIANAQNYIWHQYPTYGFNIFGGVKVKF